MFCFQCEQTAKGEGCTKIGVCGKQPDTAALQDLLVHALKGLSLYAVAGNKAGVRDAEIDTFTCEAIFSTLTNVNFDAARFVRLINRAVELREALKGKVVAAGGNVEFTHPAAHFQPAATQDELVAQGEGVGVKSDPDLNPDEASRGSAALEMAMYAVEFARDRRAAASMPDDLTSVILHADFGGSPMSDVDFGSFFQFSGKT